ncbi:MAG: class I SAM-dependent methyltransferase [Verrucomicrobia bacterium]|nr:MAG: class I SAM-dependent methyltransferase [Verrucomicrobiota bacterium]
MDSRRSNGRGCSINGPKCLPFPPDLLSCKLRGALAEGANFKESPPVHKRKSTVAEIRARFDADVERFSNLETGQSATIDAPLTMELIVRAAAITNPQARHVLDIGCGAGNYALKLLQHLPGLDATLVDLSEPMLQRAKQRVRTVTTGRVSFVQGDIRELELGCKQFDIVLAAAVFHHLREEAEWQSVFAKVYAALKPGGSLWVADLIEHSVPAVQKMMWERYGECLRGLKDVAYRDQVLAYVEQEDTPRPLIFQLDLLRDCGFRTVEILHKNNCFAAFGAIR